MSDLNDVVGVLEEIRDTLRMFPEHALESLEQKALVENVTTLAEMKAGMKMRYSFTVTETPKEDFSRKFGVMFAQVVMSIPFWLAGLYLLVRFVKWAWVR